MGAMDRAAPTITAVERRAGNEVMEKKLEELDKRMASLIKACESNNKAITELSDNTEGLLNAWVAVNGAVKTGVVIGRFIKWATGLSIVGVLFAYVAQKGG